MIIELPKSFEYQKGDGRVVVHDGIMEITSMPFGFDEIMYQLVYYQLEQLKERRCYCCGKVLKDGELTLDHYYPRNHGGISIPNNLKPCCATCNSTKSDFTLEEFERLRQIKSEYRRKVFRKKVTKRNIIGKETRGVLIPEDWYQIQERIFCFLPTISTNRLRGSAYRRTLKEYRKYGKICKPVVISKNKVVLDGFSAFIVANDLEEQPPLPVITLENVIVNV